jgi:hypothetical protein
MFSTRPVVYILYRKPFDDNIYKQWELIYIKLVIDFGKWVNVALKGVVGNELVEWGNRFEGFWVL